MKPGKRREVMLEFWTDESQFEMWGYMARSFQEGLRKIARDKDVPWDRLTFAEVYEDTDDNDNYVSIESIGRLK
jgi:hypothetical protein